MHVNCCFCLHFLRVEISIYIFYFHSSLTFAGILFLLGPRTSIVGWRIVAWTGVLSVVKHVLTIARFRLAKLWAFNGLHRLTCEKAATIFYILRMQYFICLCIHGGIRDNSKWSMVKGNSVCYSFDVKMQVNNRQKHGRCFIQSVQNYS